VVDWGQEDGAKAAGGGRGKGGKLKSKNQERDQKKENEKTNRGMRELDEETGNRQKVEEWEGITNKEWMNAFEAAEYCGVSYGAIRNMTYRREIPFYKFGRRLRFRVEDIRNLLLNGKTSIQEWKPCR
jgi:excisionase family DNA binding protein